MNKRIELLVKRIGEFADIQKPVDLGEWFAYLTMNVVGEMAFSGPFGFLESGKDIDDTIKHMDGLVLYTNLGGHFVRLHELTVGNPLIIKFDLLSTNTLYNTVKRAVEERKTYPEVRLDMLEHWISVNVEHPERMEKNELLNTEILTLGGATETINATLQASFYYMLRHSKQLERVRAEISSRPLSKIVS